MSKPIHTPETLEDASNAIGYFLVLSIVTCGLLFIMVGMISPIFWPKWWKRVTAEAGEPGDTAHYGIKVFSAILMVLYFVGSWAIYIWSNLFYKM